jgi:predicted RNase H-like HicB family nuclease
MRDYVAVIEGDKETYSGYLIDIEGVYAVGDSPEDVAARLRSVLLERRSEGEVFPEPTSQAALIRI